LQGFRDQPVEGSTMEILKSGGRHIHWFKVNRSSSTVALDTVKQASWKVAAPDNAGEISATGWFFAKLLAEQLNVPIGLIACNYGGSSVEAWMRPELLAGYTDYVIPGKGEKISVVNRTPTTLYNGMLHPVIGYGIRGCLWYQGESNSRQAKEYQTLFPALIADWREKWGQGEFPFLFVQIAPYNLMPPEIREAQLLTWKKTPNTAMTVTTDVGHRSNIHPILKEPVGARLALAARALAYGEKMETEL